MAVLREILAKVGVDVDDRDLQDADKSISDLKDNITSLATVAAVAFTGRAVAHMVKGSIETGDQLDKVSSKLGITTDMLQEYQYAAQLTGVPVTALNMGLQRFVRRTAEAAMGTGSALKTLQKYHIQVKNTDGSLRSTEDVLNDVADTIQGTADEQEKLRIAFSLFDSEGAAMVNTLRNGSAGLTEMREEIHAIGGVMDKDLIAQSVEATDNMLRFEKSMFGIKNVIATVFVPWVNRGVQAFIKLVGWFRESPRAIAILKAALLGVSIAITGSLLVSIVKLTKAFGPMLLRMAPMILSTLAWAAALTVIVLLIEDFYTWLNGGDAVFPKYIEWLDQLYEKVANLIPGLRELRELGQAIGDFFAGDSYELSEAAQESQFIDALNEARKANAARTRAQKLIDSGGLKKGETREEGIRRVQQSILAPGSQGSAPAGGSNNNTTVNQNVHAPININAPGGNPTDIRKQMEKFVGGLFKDAGAALPQGSG